MAESGGGLTHLDASGSAHMVDVGGKDVTDRRAVAECVVRMKPETAALAAAGESWKLSISLR
jgi:cyclic pyranopterin phosphate synthase